MPPKVTFHLAKTCFPKNPSFRREEIYIQSFSFCHWKILLKLGKTVLEGKHFHASGNHFLRFSCQKKQYFYIMETYFLTNALFCVVETDFWLVQTICDIVFQRLLPVKALLRLLEKLFWTNSSFWLLEKDFFSCGNRLLYYFTRELFSTSGSHHFICLGEISLLFRDSLLLVETGKSKFWKITWFLLLVTDFLASGNHLYLPFSYTPATASFIFQSNGNVVWSEFYISVRRNRFFG